MCIGVPGRFIQSRSAGSGWDEKDLTGRTRKWAATQLVMNTWFRKGGGEKSFSFLISSCKNVYKREQHFYLL